MDKSVIGTMVIYFTSFLCLCFLLNLIKLLNKIWWTPIRIQSAMRLQGIKGPSYSFLHGNTKEITTMIDRATNNPMELSHEMLPRIQPHIYSWTKLYGTVFLNWYGPRAQLVVTEPDQMKEILNNKGGAYLKALIQPYADKFLGDGLLASQGDKWLKMRKLANHAFHGECLKDMFPAMIASVNTMLLRWRQNGVKEIEVFQEFKVLTSEIISRTAFGSSYLEGQKIFDMLTRLGRILTRNHFKVKIPLIGNLLKTHDDVESDKLENGIRDCLLKMIKKREEEFLTGQQDTSRSDFLGLLLKAHHDIDTTKKISADDIIDECKAFYVAGHITTACALTWTVFLLAIHADWQEKARKEVVELFGEQIPNAESIGKLKIMIMIVNESLRLYPPVFNITRETQREVRLGNISIPQKMLLNLSVLALNHNPNIWGEDVHLFKPERFAEGVTKASKNNEAAFLPFGSGPRTCVGLNFAVAEMKVALSMILQHYRLNLSPTYVHSPVHNLVICPKYGLQIMLHAL